MFERNEKDMKKKKIYSMILLSCLLTLILGTTTYASDIEEASAELTAAVEQKVAESQHIIDQVKDLADTDNESPSSLDLQSLADTLSETSNSLTETAYALQEEASASTQMTGSIMDLTSAATSSTDIRNIFQQLQDQLSQPNPIKDTLGTLNAEIQALQRQINEADSYLKAAEEFWAQQHSSDSSESAPIPEDMAAFFDANGLTRTDDWSRNVTELENLMYQSNGMLQNKMMELPDAMSEYNNYMSGLFASMNDSLNTIQSLNTGSIYNTGNAKLITTPVVTSGLLGLAVGMLLMYLLLRHKKKESAQV